MITPAISVLSAVEGLAVVDAGFEPSRDADRDRHPGRPVRDPERAAPPGSGTLFGPIMLVYFVTLAVLGVMHIVEPSGGR